MEYPTLEQVEAADPKQLAEWFRFLPTPGVNAVNMCMPLDVVNHAIKNEDAIMDRIIRRLNESVIGAWSCKDTGGANA
jgi:hypothetical protein